MRDETVTETGFVLPTIGAAHDPVPGVVVIFQRGPCPLASYRVDRARVLGRASPDVTIGDQAISREHARLDPAPGGVLVTDLGSHNGTFIDGARVNKEQALAPFGAFVRMAKTILLVTDDVVPFELLQPNPFPALVGGPGLSDARVRISMVARAPTPVLVEGDTGTGKEVVANVLHDASGRRGKLVGLNCAALAPELVESELFGHAKGSFSGSSGARSGLFRTANEGTLLLDEVGELPPPVQAKLLRVIESGEVRAVGEDTGEPVDVRIVAATNRDLGAMVAEGAFRGDLFHRIAATRIRLPSLAERTEDIAQLAAQFLAPDTSLNVMAMEMLLVRGWSGNVRELRHAIQTAESAARTAGRTEIVPEDVALSEPLSAPGADDDLRTRITQSLAAAGGNVTHAARELGMARSGVYEAIKRLRINPAAFRRR